MTKNYYLLILVITALVFSVRIANGASYLSSPLFNYQVNSWFDHSTPQYSGDQYPHQMTRWDGKVFDDRNGDKIGVNWYDGHDGIDLKAMTSIPVYSAINGEVTLVGFEAGGLGNYVKIWSTSTSPSLSTIYGHLNNNPPPLVSNGDYVLGGQLIAYSGNTGSSTGPHLHFSLKSAQTGGFVIDPYGFIGTTISSGYEQGIPWVGTTTDHWGGVKNKGYLWNTTPPLFTWPITYPQTTISTTTTWKANNVYVIQSNVTVNSGATLNIEPSTIVKFASSAYIKVYGTLNASTTQSGPINPNIGTTTLNVYFTSLKDDTIGGDTNNDATSTSPQKGDWGRIENSNGSIIMSNSIIKYGGSITAVFNSINGYSEVFNSDIYSNKYYGISILGGEAIIDKTRSHHNGYDGIHTTAGTTTVSNSELNDNIYYGLYSPGGYTYLEGVKLFNNLSGIYNSTSTVVATSSSFFGNTSYGAFNNKVPTTTAISNWWGDASGPYHPTKNPSGSGQRVSDRIDFIPWLTSDPNP